MIAESFGEFSLTFIDERNALLSLTGEIDIANAGDLRAALAVAANAPHLIVDLSGVTYLDSTALAELMRYRNEARRRSGKLTLVVSDPRVRRVFEVTNLAFEFAIVANLDAVPELARTR